MPQTILCGKEIDGEHDEPLMRAWLTIDKGEIISVSDRKPAGPGTFLDFSRYTIFSHAQALKALTSAAARSLGIEKKIGSIKQGLKADLGVIEGDPLKDIYAIENIKMVMKEGNIIFREILV